MDETESGKSSEIPEEAPKRKKKEQVIRKHKVENVNRNNLAQVLDAYAVEGRVVIALNPSRDIGGSYEVVSWKNELLS